MSELYSNLSEIYEMMYRTFINYEEEFGYYRLILRNHQAHSLVELGCGTGNLAEKFIGDKFEYMGVDLNKSMLEIARKKVPEGKFVQADMRYFKIEEKKDACLFVGRTSAYLLSNRDMLETLHSININLNKKGIACFDCIDAEKFLPQIKEGKHIVHEAGYEGRKFRRESDWKIVPAQGGCFNWDSVYFEIFPDGKRAESGRDSSIIRAFTKKEINELLVESGFTLLETNNRASYAFDTFVIVAQKNPEDGNV
jgi:SAM-dependent methyltransferase